jgi:transcriptional regulator with XRE-family HTH domain
MKYRFGEKLRAVRERRGLTMREVAEKAGLSESLISQIERNRVSPAIDTLLNLVEVLDVDLEYIFADFRKERSVNIVRSNERRKLVLPGVTYEQLVRAGSPDEIHGIEALYLEIQPGCQKGNTEYGHPGRELGIVVEGEGEFQIGNQIHPLASGDSISFEADIPHIVRNTGPGVFRAYWIVTPPKGDLQG